MQLSSDGWLLFATCGVRSFAYGFLSVILGLYLDSIGLSTTAIGWLFTAALGGGAVMTVIITSVADSISRKMAILACRRVKSDLRLADFCAIQKSEATGRTKLILAKHVDHFSSMKDSSDNAAEKNLSR